ncbi:P22 phage major capsid protein family protein [Pseudoalteromonas sp.]|uniref:P22 phage major capsid protein family protein n=1 Tax=Pseudoalteromonas sp. TaxID=53249 RepID=UPI0035614AAA
MANNFDSNFTRKLMESFLDKFESSRVLTKNVDTQLFQGKFNGSTGDTIDVKRPTDYNSVRTAKGDVSGETKSDIITGKASAEVQDYFTVFVDYDEADEALKLGQLDRLLAPMATRVVTDFETDYAEFMMRNTGLLAGSVGTAATKWDHVAEGGSIMEASGVPKDGNWCYAVNSHTQRKLAGDQRSLGGETADGTANEMATINNNFAGMKVMTATTLGSYKTGVGADRAGTVVGTPVATYLAAKDTMTQVIGVAGFQANLAIKAGETVTVSGRNRLNMSTRKPILDENGDQILFSGTVTQDVTLSGTGTGNLTITGPAIYEANGQYNTVDSAIAASDVVTLGGAENKIIQPNLFWHKQAFTVASVPIKKLHSTDTIATTEDGLQLRVSKGVGFLENNNKVRIDFRPAYGVMNPFFAGQGFGRV